MSIRIIHTFGRNAGLVQAFTQDVVRFGRGPGSDVAFDPAFDRDASTRHAELRREGGQWSVVDLESRNGTFVRGERVSRSVIASGDELRFGATGPRVRVEIVQEAAVAQAGAPPLHPRVGKGGTLVDTPVHVGHAAYAPTVGVADPSPAAPVFVPPAASAPAPAPAPIAAPAAGAPGPDGKRVGSRTIAMMISSALATARAPGGARSPNTHELSAYVDRHVSAASDAHRRSVRTLGALIVLALAGLAGVIFWSTRSNDDIDRLRAQLAQLSPDDPRRKDIEGRLGSLHPANASFGRNLYDRSRKGIFMLAAGGEGFCTAFAVRPNVLATNAHCIVAAKKARGLITALENEGRGGVSFAVTDMRPHPSYRDGDEDALTPDVGVVTIGGKAATVLDLATPAELAASGAGDEVYLIGFPGRLMDSANPSATFLAAHIGRVTNAAGRPGVFADAWLVQHDAATTHGTSGSPVFNGNGKVIAINAGGYLEGDDETISGRKTEVVKDSPYKFGMRIDLLNAVLR